MGRKELTVACDVSELVLAGIGGFDQVVEVSLFMETPAHQCTDQPRESGLLPAGRGGGLQGRGPLAGLRGCSVEGV